MNKITFIFVALLSGFVLLSSCSQPTTAVRDESDYISSVAENLEDYAVRVLSFHTTNRCKTCLTIERIVRETVLEEYKDQVESGRMKLYVMDVEQAENRQTAEDYMAFGSALFVSSGHDENIQTTDVTNDAFMYAGTNPERFKEILRSAINTHLE